MNESVVSKDLIRQQADAAAARWALHPSRDKPENIYDPHAAPEAHAQWKREFEIALLRHTAPARGKGA